jgi:predicted ATPase/DNA-binding winged helix-turn-helix (wHTH) protein
LRAAERVLEKDGVALKIGSRAFDILAVLLKAAPELVSNRELMSCVWGSLVVDEGNLRLQIAALRKALGEVASGASYITNIPARGYCFTGSLEWASTVSDVGNRVPTPLSAQLPRPPRQMVGRDREVTDVIKRLRKQRFVSIVGAGGIGKTTVALAVAHEVLSEFAGAVHFLDLTTIQDPRLIGGTLAARLGLTLVSDDALPVLLNYLRERRVLLVLDNCEHLVEAMAKFAETLFLDASEVHILATSRESLRAEGEWVYHLSALDCPPPDAVTLTAAQALTYPAVQLFARQVGASGYPFELDDEGAPIVAELCRRLDGIALALELAACRVGVYGLQRIGSLLDDQFRLLWRGRRTALPRHQTLRAALDWSYNLLSEQEQMVLRHLAIFVGGFSLEDAVAVAGETLDSAEVTEIIAALVEKSLVTLDPTVSMRYRLLDTTRTYARQQLDERGERMKLARRHCEYLCSVLERFEVTAALPYRPEAAAFFADHLSDVHTAHEWSFSAQGDPRLGVRLAAACAPLYFQLSLLPECSASTQRALSMLDHTSRGTRLELELQVCSGLSLAFSKGNVLTLAALDRGLQLAKDFHEPASELLILHALFVRQIRSGDYRGLTDTARRFEAAARRAQDPLGDALAHAISAIACHQSGDIGDVPKLAQAALSSPVHLSKLSASSFNDSHNAGLRGVLAQSLWYLGYPDQAVAAADAAVRRSADAGYPRPPASVLSYVLFVYVRTGEWATADALSEQLLAHVAKHRLATYTPVAIGWQGSLAVLRGDYSRGTELLERALAELRAYEYGMYIRPLSAEVAEGYAKAGRHDLAYTTVCEALAWSEDHGPSIELPELMRVKGEILISKSSAAAEDCLLESLHLARAQSLLSMELRIGMSLARLWADRGLFDKGLELLTTIHGRFTEGFGTRDLVAAANLLAEIRSRVTRGG